jgi:hypothetical protein
VPGDAQLLTYESVSHAHTHKYNKNLSFRHLLFFINSQSIRGQLLPFAAFPVALREFFLYRLPPFAVPAVVLPRFFRS